MMLQHCLNLLGWQGGTIHQVREELQHKHIVIQTRAEVIACIITGIESDELHIMMFNQVHRTVDANMILNINFRITAKESAI